MTAFRLINQGQYKPLNQQHEAPATACLILPCSPHVHGTSMGLGTNKLISASQGNQGRKFVFKGQSRCLGPGLVCPIYYCILSKEKRREKDKAFTKSMAMFGPHIKSSSPQRAEAMDQSCAESRK